MISTINLWVVGDDFKSTPASFAGVTLAIAFQEAGEAVDGFDQLFAMRQEHHAEVIRMPPVKTAALNQ